LLLLSTTFNVLELARRPLLLSALGKKLGAMFLKCRNGVENKLFILGDLDSRTRDNHGSQCLIALEKVLLCISRDNDEVRLNIFGILDEKSRIDDRSQGLSGKVAALFELLVIHATETLRTRQGTYV
jgi:hypothetical protein